MNPGIREMAPKFRKFTKEMCEDIEFYVKNGLTSATAIFPLLKAKHPAHPIHKKDLYNAIQKYKVGKQDIVINDASSLLRHLANEKLHNSEWFFEFQLTGNEQRLSSLIWMSPEQRLCYTRFHEVLLFDCTAGTNRHDMVLCLLIVVDNNTRSRLIASALLEDETENSFIWVLQQLKISSNEIYPRVIYTDNDPAMANAISSIFPQSKHNLCIFHIDLNLKKNLQSKLGAKIFNEFRSDFFICRNSLTEEIFETRWVKLREKYPAAVKYLNKMLEPTKESWATCYINKLFTCGINTLVKIDVIGYISDTRYVCDMCNIYV
jgi:hypothetical protein